MHGIDLVNDGPNSIQLWAVNHDRRHESILKFSHKLGSSDLVLEKEYVHPLIKTPNAVASSGPHSFFITNDHYFYSAGTILGFPVYSYLRHLESVLGPFKWASGLVHCDASTGKLDCKEVHPSGQHPHANGLLLVDGGKTLLVNEITKGTTTVYDVDLKTKALTVKQEVVCYCPPVRELKLTTTSNRILEQQLTIFLRFLAQVTSLCPVSLGLRDLLGYLVLTFSRCLEF